MPKPPSPGLHTQPTSLTSTTPELLRPDVWEALLPGLRAARDAGREYISSGRYVPRRSPTPYQVNDVGWPQTTTDRLSTRLQGEPDFAELFSMKAGQFTNLLVPDIGALHRAVRELGERALSDDQLLRGLSRLAPLMPAEEQLEQIEFEITKFLVGGILNRAEATRAETDDDLLRIYSQLDQARFADELVGDVVIPLVAVTFDADEPVRIDADTWLEPLTEADHRARALSWMRHDNVNPYVAAGATHAIVTRRVQFVNTVNVLSGRSAAPFGFSSSVVENVAEAIDIVAERSTGYAQVLVRPQGWAHSWVEDLPPLWSAWTGRAYPEDLDSRVWDKTFERIAVTDVSAIAQAAAALAATPNNVRIAARRCRRVTFRDDPEDQLLDTAIGLEALLGKEQDALVHRLAQRAAVALADLLPPQNTYTLVKQFYGVRSKIAHGSTPKRFTCRLGDNEWDATSVGRYLLRALLKDRLLTETPWDAESLDAQMLTSLGPGPEPGVDN